MYLVPTVRTVRTGSSVVDMSTRSLLRIQYPCGRFRQQMTTKNIHDSQCGI